MTAPITAGRTGGVSFRLFGVPVTIHLTFVLVLAVLGFGLGSVDRLLVWIGVGGAAVLVHELGHALVGRLAGLSPRIDLAGFGGVTSWTGRGRGSHRGWSLAISIAGPGTGLLGGLVAVQAGAPCCTLRATNDLGTFAAEIWVFASVWWGLLNLLPMLPLDGGQTMRELLPGTPQKRAARAEIVSVVVGGAATAAALLTGWTFAGLVAGWITWNNVSGVLRRRQADAPATQQTVAARRAWAQGDRDGAIQLAAEAVGLAGPANVRSAAASTVVEGLLNAGRRRDAYRVVTDPRLDVPVDPVLTGRAIAGHPDRGRIDTVLDRVRPVADQRTRATVATVFALHGRFRDVLATLSEGPVPEGTAVALQLIALDASAWQAAAAIGEGALAAGEQTPFLAYNTACALARLGEHDRALGRLADAVDLGFADLDRLRTDDDLRPLHGHPGWTQLLARATDGGAGTPYDGGSDRR